MADALGGRPLDGAFQRFRSRNVPLNFSIRSCSSLTMFCGGNDFARLFILSDSIVVVATVVQLNVVSGAVVGDAGKA